MRKSVLAAAAMLGLVLAGPLQAQEGQKVSRLPPLPQPLDPILQDMFDKRHAQGGAIINLQLVTGHAPKFARAASAMAFTIRFDAVTPRRLIELTIMRTAQIVGSNYEINQHLPLIKMCGYSDAQIAALPAWRTSTLFDNRERAVLGYVEQMAHGGDVDDATFAALEALFTPQQIVELTYTVGSYYANGLLTKALRIAPETDGRETVAGKC
jgi:alkylhydroperoxidase family enzyme